MPKTQLSCPTSLRLVSSISLKTSWKDCIVSVRFSNCFNVATSWTRKDKRVKVDDFNSHYLEGGVVHPNGGWALGFLPWTGRKCSPDFSFELAAPGLVRTGALNRPVHKPWGKGWSLRAGLAPAIYFHHNQKFSTKQRLHTLFWMTFAGLFQGG